MVASSEPNAETTAAVQPDVVPRREVMYRHTVAVRLTHWVNALILVLLLISGLRLFNYHPALYWGNYGYRGVPPVLAIAALEDIDTDEPVGVTTIMGHNFITTGVLGVSYDASGEPVSAAFPSWLTLSDTLAGAPHVHFSAAWLLVVNALADLLLALLRRPVPPDLFPAAALLRPQHPPSAN